MKSLFTLFLLASSVSVFAQDCYPFKTGVLCVPFIGQVPVVTMSNTEYKFKNPLVKKFFNQSANYSGPNCYNAALILSGVLKDNEVRYVSPEEFELLLKKYFYEVEKPLEGDLVVYEANSQRGHVSYWLGDNLVFHKKSFHKNYLYRISSVEEVGKIEKGEWQPSPMEDFPRWTELDIGKTTKAYYRRLARPNNDQFSESDLAWLDILNHMNLNLIKDGPNWAVGKNMGLVSENYLSKAETIAKKENAHPYVLAKIKSLKDQVFQSLEEMYYSRARGQRRVEAINEEICFHENDYTQKLILKTATLLKVEPKAFFEKVQLGLRSTDRKRCLVDIISQTK